MSELPGMDPQDSENPTPVELDGDSFDQLTGIRTEMETLNARLTKWEEFAVQLVTAYAPVLTPLFERFLLENGEKTEEQKQP